MAGYSGTPLAAKLGIKPGAVVRVIHAPGDYRRLVAPLPDGARIATRKTGPADLVHHFSTEKAELAAALRDYRGRLGAATPVWISWPKKSAKLATDITEDRIRDIALPLGYVDIKVCAVSNVWSGLKLVVRKELRAKGSR